MIKNVLLVLFYAIGLVFQSDALDFDEFKEEICGKDGETVYNYVTPLLKRGLEYQISQLKSHMDERGHFGKKEKITKRNTTMKWNTFFVKPDYKTLYSTDEEKKNLIKTIWNSKKLKYSKDVVGSANSVCLDGRIDNVMGVAFNNKDVCRFSVENSKDVSAYNKENLIALKIAVKKRTSPEYIPTEADFPAEEDLKIAKVVNAADPKIVENSTIRLTLEIDSGEVKFNTSYPF